MAGILYIFTRSDIFRLTLVPDIIVLINDEFRSSGCLKSIIFKTLLENKTQFQKLFSSNFGNNFFFWIFNTNICANFPTTQYKRDDYLIIYLRCICELIFYRIVLNLQRIIFIHTFIRLGEHLIYTSP